MIVPDPIIQPSTYGIALRFRAAAARERTTIRDYPGGRWWHAYDDLTGTIMGTACLAPHGRSRRICGVYVAPEWRGHGIGSMLTDELERAASMDPEAVGIDAFAWNPAHYTARGWTVGHARPTGAVHVYRTLP